MATTSTPTSKLLDTIESEVHQAASTYQFAGSLEQTSSFLYELSQRTQKRIEREMAFDTALIVAKNLGRRIALAKHVENVVEVEIARHDLALVMSYVVIPDRDEARRRTAVLAENSSGALFRLGAQEYGVIASTTAAVALLELSAPTATELCSAHRALEESFRWRKKGSIGAAYHNFNLCVAKRRLLEIGEISPSKSLFARITKGFKRALSLFEKFDDEDIRDRYHENILNTLSIWLQWEIRQVQESYIYKHRGDTETIGDEIDVQYFLNALRTSPQSLGYQQTPSWVPSEAQVISDAIDRIQHFDAYVEAAETFLAKAPHAYMVEVELYALKETLTSRDQDQKVSVGALKLLWASGDNEAFFHQALETVGNNSWLHKTKTDYRWLLQCVYRTFKKMRRTWPRERLHRLLKKYTVELRFSACELAHLGEWKIAFKLLEETRGLVASDTASLIDSEPLATIVTDQETWLHLTHSPRGTYLICNVDNHYFGSEFTDLPGSLLSKLFSGFEPPGLIHPINKNNRRTRSAAIEAVSKALLPTAEWILTNATGTVNLHAGGFFQTFPVWALGQLPEAIAQRRIKFYKTPSQTLTRRHHPPTAPEHINLAVHEAAAVPDLEELRGSLAEIKILETEIPQNWSISTSTAAPATLCASGKEADILHFTGHSFAQIDPMESGLITYAGTLSVRSILKYTWDCQLVVLSSCESGLPQNFSLQDEQLSIQSAFWYKGANFVIGTYWPVSDFTAKHFTEFFYRTLFKQTEARFRNIDEAIYSSWVAAMNHLRKRFPKDRMEWASFGLFGKPRY